MGEGFKLRLVEGEELSEATTSARVGKVLGLVGQYLRCLEMATRLRQTLLERLTTWRQIGRLNPKPGGQRHETASLARTGCAYRA
jgi:hypothetical protein